MKNPIIEGYLKKFIAEHGNFDTKKPDVHFEHMMNYLIIKRYFLDEFSIDDIHTGGGGDLGLDGVAIVINNFLVTTLDDARYLLEKQFKSKYLKVDFIFIQSKTSAKFDSGEILTFFSGIDDFFETNDKPKNDKIIELQKIKNLIYENSSRFSENPSLNLFYATLGSWQDDKNIVSEKNKAENRYESKSIFDFIEIEFFDIKQVMQLHQNVELKIRKTIEMQKSTTFPATENIKDAYIGIVYLKDFIELISDNEGKLLRVLFYDNVRDYQGENSVNKEIIDTIVSNNQRYFGFFNNGITIVAKELIKSGDKITIQDFQVVNGCQTSTILHSNKQHISNDAFIAVKIIGTDNSEIINSIIRATNRQTEVKPEAFESLSIFHKELEEFFNHIPSKEEDRLYYERRNKQYVQLDVPKANIVTLAMQVKSYIAIFKEQPHSTHRYYGELLKSNKDTFAENNNKYPYFTSTYLLVKIDRLFKQSKIPYRFRGFKYHLAMKIRRHVGVQIPPPNSNKNDDYCKKIIDICNNEENLIKLCKNTCDQIGILSRNNFKNYRYDKMQRLKDFTNELMNIK